jgi:hypothetical protein
VYQSILDDVNKGYEKANWPYKGAGRFAPFSGV